MQEGLGRNVITKIVYPIIYIVLTRQVCIQVLYNNKLDRYNLHFFLDLSLVKIITP